ncbi:unnamed protein product [Paramecium pentaurelia]|uniref:Uncharacterized protein n=1 Tax=Paramecium pentaurelia TaxID=43138 RepID=A0A8S1WY16_9CILI|nr:unnamed protein product [Paramecium pentaurelia]
MNSILQNVQKFRVQDILTLLNFPLADKSILNDIDVYRFGNNQKIKRGCYGCYGDVEGIRYIVLNCLLGKITDLALLDFCQDFSNEIRTGRSRYREYCQENQDQLLQQSFYVVIENTILYGYYNY